jgi:hypothetical protein
VVTTVVVAVGIWVEDSVIEGVAVKSSGESAFELFFRVKANNVTRQTRIKEIVIKYFRIWGLYRIFR